ncbi:MAG TPA: DUF2490 domain-containing protein [Saprospiraceae bacterium]|nr:DUF2490 domain-containing protein [Saprospiraceae bacterium]
MNRMNKMRIYKVLILLLFLQPIFTHAQQSEMGNWLMYFGTNKINENFSIHTEIQYRNHTLIPNNVEQLLLRVGLNYHFSNKAFTTAGYAYIPSYVFESKQKNPEVTEHRVWQQFILTNKIGRVKFEHRYRLEQRWVNQSYKNRFRYRLMFFVPFNKNRIEKGTLFLGLYDEIFINDNKVFFDRNRLYVALGYQFHKAASVQIGTLNQRVNDFDKWYLQAALVFNTDWRNKTKE